MSLDDSGILRLMSEKMSYLGQKQSVLAQNVANANTPGYKARTIEAFSFSTALKEAGGDMKATDAKHIIPASMAGVNEGTRKMRSFETVPSGNSVELEQQMLDVSQTNIDYQATVSIYSKFMALFKTALGK